MYVLTKLHTDEPLAVVVVEDTLLVGSMDLAFTTTPSPSPFGPGGLFGSG
jgi:hypothetical protein